ncbi:hypothetical protein ACMFMG_001660 [Clarireedia jacksonii]
MSKFYFSGGSGDISSDDEDSLPYPKALPRSDFLAPAFDAPTYLSTLSDRHQTLEDLRSDLRERSQALSKELLDLVNTNYEQFLSLGSDLKGGEEKVEDVRMGLLGFKRGVEDVRGKVRERKVEVEGLLGEKKGVSKDIALGRKLLEVDSRLEELEDSLMVASLGRSPHGLDDSWSEDEEDEEEEEGELTSNMNGTSTKKLQRFVLDYRSIEHLTTTVGLEHPFIAAQEPRLLRLRNTIVLDLNAALKQAMSAGEGGEEAVKVLRDAKSIA